MNRLISRALLGPVFSLAFIALLAPHVNAEDCRWIDTEGEAQTENLTAEEARQLAANRARIKAIESIAGVNVKGATLLKDMDIAADFIHALGSGFIVSEKPTKWETSQHQRDENSPPVLYYKALLSSCVSSSGERDPYFTIKGELNRQAFMDGEEAVITVVCSRDCYLAILNLTSDNRFKVLLPNEYEKSVRLKAGQTYAFPPQGFSLEIKTSHGRFRDTEAFYIIATKESFDLRSLFKKNEGMSASSFFKTYLNLPASTRSEEMLVYEVRKKKE